MDEFEKRVLANEMLTQWEAGELPLDEYGDLIRALAEVVRMTRVCVVAEGMGSPGLGDRGLEVYVLRSFVPGARVEVTVVEGPGALTYRGHPQGEFLFLSAKGATHFADGDEAGEIAWGLRAPRAWEWDLSWEMVLARTIVLADSTLTVDDVRARFEGYGIPVEITVVHLDLD
jgi:hypothetical protein